MIKHESSKQKLTKYVKLIVYRVIITKYCR